MKKTRKTSKPNFTSRSLYRQEKIRRWSLAAGVMFCALVLVSVVKLNNISTETEILHRSADKVVPVYLNTQGSFVPDEVTFWISYAPESTEIVEFFANPHWEEVSRLEGEGEMQIVLELSDNKLERDFATVYLRVENDSIIKYEITEKTGDTELITGFTEVLM